VLGDVAGQHRRCHGSGAGDQPAAPALLDRPRLHRRRSRHDQCRTIVALEQRGLRYILGARERSDKLVRDVVLNDTAPCVPLTIEKRGKDTDDSAKAVTLAGTRYIVCVNHQEAEKAAAERAAILASLERQLKRGDKALVGNTGYRRFLKTVGDGRYLATFASPY
jgi:hypothetical protein